MLKTYEILEFSKDEQSNKKARMAALELVTP